MECPICSKLTCDNVVTTYCRLHFLQYVFQCVTKHKVYVVCTWFNLSNFIMLENILSMYIKHATGYVFGNMCTTCIQPKNIHSVPCFSYITLLCLETLWQHTHNMLQGNFFSIHVQCVHNIKLYIVCTDFVT